MKRMHIPDAFEDFSESIWVNRTMFEDAEAALLKSDYCKWELANPTVKFAISARDAKLGVDHLGIHVETDAELAEMNARLTTAQLLVEAQIGTTCCHARSDKVWTADLQGVAWKTFRTLEVAPVYGESREQPQPQSSAACCAPTEAVMAFRSRL